MNSYWALLDILAPERGQKLALPLIRSCSRT
jgi:hypothetical protein